MQMKLTFIIDPLFYFTLALYVGEASLAVIGIPIDLFSSAMYFFMLIGLLLMFGKGKYKIKSGVDFVVFLYVYILLRNITFNEQTIIEYWIPNAATFLLIYIIARIDFGQTDYYNFLEYSYFFVFALMLLGIGKALFVDERLAVFGGPNGFYKFALLFQGINFAKFLFSKQQRYFFYMIVGTLLAILTASKGAIVTLLMLFPLEYIVYLSMEHNVKDLLKRFFKIAIVVSMVLLCFNSFLEYFPGLYQAFSRGTAIFSMTDSAQLTSVSSRLYMYDLSMKYFYQNPIFGMGAKYMYYDTLNTIYAQPYAHNVFYEMLGEQGVIGVILLLGVLKDVLWGVIKKGYKNYTMLSLFLGFVVYFLGAQFSGNILDTKVALLFAELILCFDFKKRYSLDWRNREA